MTDTELIELLRNDNQRQAKEIEELQRQVELWEANAEKLTKKLLEADAQVKILQGRLKYMNVTHDGIDDD